MILEIVKNNTEIKETGCWEWQMSFSSNGYPQKWINGKIRSVHRALAEELGILTDQQVVRHKCHNTKCCNPAHLIGGSHQENYKDSIDAHIEASKRRRKVWIVAGVRYSTCADAVTKTGISMHSIIKFTSSDGVFDVVSYRNNCYISRKTPKI